jgi:NhaP-type Na+/H+ or K+/H+ antiporter
MLVQTIVAAAFLGVLAQVVAHKFKLPAILPLLVTGMACGPEGLGLLQPAVLGHGLEVIIHLGIAVILFEGGLSLDLHQLRQYGGPLGRLLSLGVAVTGAGAAWLAHGCIGMSWPTAALFGAIVSVTGPTVIAPLLRHLIAPKRVRTVLLSEGLIVDLVGAVLAYLVLQWIERSGLALKPLFFEIVTLVAVGCMLGFVAGRLAAFAIRGRFLAAEHRNLVALALLWGCFFLAERLAPQSGILSSLVMGLTVAAARLPDVSPLRAFKGQLTVLVISVLFILLSGRLDLGAIADLGLGGAGVVAGLILVVRPLSVWLSLRGAFDWRELTLIGLTAPRGIVAAAVASLSAIELRGSGSETDARLLEGMVYLVILATCVWATLAASVLPRLLGYTDDPSRRRIVLIGAHPLTAALARRLADGGYLVALVDAVAAKLQAFAGPGITLVHGDARDAATYDQAGLERDGLVVAMTPNDDLNVLAAELARDEFEVEHPAVVLKRLHSDFGALRRAFMDLVGGEEIDVGRWNAALENGEAELREWRPSSGSGLRETLLRRPGDLVVLCAFDRGRPVFALRDWEKEERLLLLATRDAWRELDPGAQPTA